MGPRQPFGIPHQLRWVVGATVLGSLLFALGLVRAQPPAPARAGVVIRFGDGRVTKACVELGDDGQATGEEALLAVGLPVIEEAGGVGAAVCKVDGEGCDYPATSCFCQCSLGAGTSCRYWAYNRLVNGQWQLSNLGASSTLVRAGDVEGWAWGDGSVNNGALPPQTTFNDVCAAAAAPTSTATATPTQPPQPTLTVEPSATAAGAPVVYVPLVGQPAPATSPTGVPSPEPPTASATPPPPTTTNAVETLAPRATTEVASPTPTTILAATPSPTASEEPTATVPSATSVIAMRQAPGAAATPTQPAATQPSQSATAMQRATPSPATRLANTATLPAAGASATPTRHAGVELATQGRSDVAPPDSYLAFGVLVIALAIGWGVVHVWRRRRGHTA